MPQFDPSSFASQLFWFGLVFALLYFAAVRPTLPKLGKVIDARDSQVAKDLDRAEAAKGQADTIRSAYDDDIKAAQSGAQVAVGAARDAASAASEARLKQLTAQLDSDADAAAVRLDAARTTARANLETTVADLTSDAVTRLTGLVVTPVDVLAALAPR
ncbi:ATPase [Sandarakinorhabdus sp.]|uniref:F0F1 ATP synthase subunit B family protein n=1 Tax=Sandarakinorhabdus sp. TaxID=1916663 RepID=UPI003342A622